MGGIWSRAWTRVGPEEAPGEVSTAVVIEAAASKAGLDALGWRGIAPQLNGRLDLKVAAMSGRGVDKRRIRGKFAKNRERRGIKSPACLLDVVLYVEC